MRSVQRFPSPIRRLASSSLVACFSIGVLAFVALVALGACKGDGGASSSASSATPTPLRLDRVSPEFLPALEAVQAAIQAGDDRAARAVLDQLLWRGPRGRTLDIAQAFERILDGREAVQALRIELVDVPRDADVPSGGRAYHTLQLVVRNDGDRPVEFSPGPATLITEHERLDVRAAFERTSETHTYENLNRLELDVDSEQRIELLAFYIEPQANTLAERLFFRLELRSGGVRREGRDLPAMRMPATEIEVVRLSEALSARSSSTAAEFAKLLDTGKVRTADALDLALRLPIDEREGALAAVQQRVYSLPETDLKELIPSLRWLTGASEPGGNPAAWRAWIVQGASAKTPEPRAKLVLPTSG